MTLAATAGAVPPLGAIVISVATLITLAAAVVAAGAILWTLYILFEIGSDGLGAGPWRRPQPNQAHTRLPADFVGLWSLFGPRSINGLAGSRESALRRLARLEAVLRGQAPADAEPSPETINAIVQGTSFEDGWLEQRVDQLEILAGLRSATSPGHRSETSPGLRSATSPGHRSETSPGLRSGTSPGLRPETGPAPDQPLPSRTQPSPARGRT